MVELVTVADTFEIVTLGKIDRLGIESIRAVVCAAAAVPDMAWSSAESAPIGDRIEFRFHHIRRYLIDAGADREYERDRHQAHHHGHGATFVAAEAADAKARRAPEADRLTFGMGLTLAFLRDDFPVIVRSTPRTIGADGPSHSRRCNA